MRASTLDSASLAGLAGARLDGAFGYRFAWRFR
jgi:hypothetical protein